MSKQESRLSIAIESQEAVRNAKAVHKELKSIQETGDFAAKSVEGTSKSLTTFSQEGAKGASSAKVLAGQIGSVGTQSKTASDGLSKVTQSSNASVASMNMASTAAQALASRIMAIATVGAAVSKMDAFAGFENRLKLVTSSQTELNQAMNDTFRIAQSSRQEWDSVVQVYQRFSENAKTLGIDMKKTAELTETVSKAVAISGASSASAEAALTQFGQALASGVLRGEELNSVMEQTPGLSKAIAQGMGITVGQLRAVAAEGKITTDVLVEALTKSKDSVDELFGKTSMTIGQSMTALNNEITKFVGEAGKTSGAAQAIAQSIQLISENLSAISSVAMLGGVAYLTKAILTKGNALRKNASDALAARSAVQVLAVQEQQLAVAVLNDAKAHLASIQATGAATQAKYGATTAALRYKQALDQVSIAQAKVDSLGGGLAKFGNIASKGLALIGGPIGALTIGVTAASAAYGYFSARAEEATAKIKQQGEVANKTTEELKKLEGRDRALAKSDLAEAFEAENKKLKELNFTFNAHMIAIQNAHKGNVEIADISNQVRQGIISQEEAVKRLNALNFIDPQQFKQLKDANFAYDDQRVIVQKNADAQGNLGTQVKLAGNEASNAQGKNAALANSHDLVTTAANKEAGAQQELAKQRLAAIQAASLEENTKNQRWINNVNAAGGGEYGVKWGNFMEKWLADKKIPSSQASTPEQLKIAHNDFLSLQKRENLQDQITKQTQAQTKAEREREAQLKKNNKLLADGNRLVGISGNSGTSTNPHLHVQYGGKKLGDKPTAEHLNRLKAGGKGLASYGVSSGMGHRTPPKAGASSDHKGLDIGMPVGTPITTNVAVKSVTTHTQRSKGTGEITGAGHYTRVVFEDGIIMELFHQVPDIHSKIKGGASAGSTNSLTYKQQENLELKDAREKKTLQADYYTIAQKDAADHEKRMADLRKHGLTKEMEMEKERYEYTKQLRELEQVLEVDGWRWVGETKINNDAAVKKLRIQASMALGEEEKKIALESAEEQRQLELSAYRRLQQEKMKEFRSTLEQQTAEYQRMYYDALARASMPQPTFNRWEAQNSYSDQMGTAWDNKQNAINQANERDPKTDQYLNDVNTRNQMLIDAEAAYQAAILAIKQKGLLDEKALRQVQEQDQLNLFSSILANGQNTFSQLAQSAKDSKGEQSGTYRAMFAMQKTFSIASSMAAAYTAYAQAFADPSAMTLPQKLAGGATVMAAVMPAITTLATLNSGFSGGGYTGRGGKYDPAGIVHKGEVVWSQEDIKRWGGPVNVDLMRQGSPQSNPMLERKRLAAIGEAKVDKAQPINIQPQIIINTPPGMSARTEQRDGKTYVTIEEVRDYLMDQLNRHNSDFNKEIRQRYELKPNRP
ncbi:tape measure protein [Acinetobacter rudis]|uniref:tape measure protein n=1 Tax=Acinetobacter rudis TaxID=632955 RepID=UPI00280C9512|nr:tape measure protein [Acinetobacter rudis]MDQ8953477.1 tape measure protein [Acinetobacter rudis]